MNRQIRHAWGLVVSLFAAAVSAQPTVVDSAAPRSASTKDSGAPAAANAVPTPGTATAAVPTQPLIFRAGSDNAALNAAALPSSSRPISNTESSQDGFDMNVSNSENTVRGGKGSFAITGQSVQAIAVPDIHTVRRGDTLWDLCGHYLGNSWDWPRVWSYNPDIRNPNWIYPGDQLRLRSVDEVGRGPYSTQFGGRDQVRRSALLGGPNPESAGLFPRTARIAPDTVFLRNEAYIEDPDRDVLGEVIGAKEEQMLLGQGNHVYLDVKPDTELKVGQELTLFEQSRKPEAVEGARQPPGEIILVKGTVRVEDYDPKKHLARAQILESVDAIERGTKLGSVGRRYLVVAPTPSQVTVWARLLTGIYPHVYLGQQQLVFIDRGTEDGLAPGNRLLVIRRGDTWRRSLETAAPSSRYRMRVDLPGNAQSEPTQLKRDDREFPEEIVGELRIVHAHKWSSLAIVAASQRELMAGDRAVARAGY
jgi:hypothetical protein